jgi:hypothetical protein
MQARGIGADPERAARRVGDPLAEGAHDALAGEAHEHLGLGAGRLDGDDLGGEALRVEAEMLGADAERHGGPLGRRAGKGDAGAVGGDEGACRDMALEDIHGG